MLQRIPSPPVDHLISGHTKSLTQLKRHKHEQECIAATGKRVYRLRVFGRHRVVIADPTLLQEFFAAEREGAVEKPDEQPFPLGHGKPEYNVFSEKTSSPMWKLVRKGTASAFQAVNMRQFHNHVVDVVNRLVEGIKAKGSSAVVNFADIGQRESFDVIGNVGFGKDFRASRDIDDTTSNTFALLTNFLHEVTLRSNNPMRKYWRSKEVIAAEAEAQKLQVLLEELVQDCQKRSPEAAGDKSIAGHLMRLRDAKGQPLSFKRMVQEFFIFFLAGSETTGHTIAWTLYFLAKNPKAMAKLEAELDEAGLLVTPSNPTPRAFSFSDIGKLHYLDHVIKESMRLQPVAASPLARVAKRDLHLSDGTVIPAGVMVEAAQYTPMRDERWGWHRGNEFLPERWEEPDMEYHVRGAATGVPKSGAQSGEEDLEIDAQVVSEHKVRRFNPFGQGLRNCLGQQLARMNVPTAIAMFVSNFKLELTPEDANKSIEELEILKGTLQPSTGIHMICTPRTCIEE
ncbi:g4423 [Coccomyxa elongata]